MNKDRLPKSLKSVPLGKEKGKGVDVKKWKFSYLNIGKEKGKGVDVKKWKFSNKELDIVLARLKENPNIAKHLLNSANDGNQEDVDVLMELSARRGYMVTVDKFK